MIDGAKQFPKGADKMLALIRTEQDLETPSHSQTAPLKTIID